MHLVQTEQRALFEIQGFLALHTVTIQKMNYEMSMLSSYWKRMISMFLSIKYES